MTDPKLTYLYPVIDRSGSIREHKEAYQRGFDSFIIEQRGVPGRCLVTLAEFDTEYEVLYALLSIHEVPPLHIQPRGGTALLDAIGRTIQTAGAQISSMPEDRRPGAVVVPIVTDGQENSSKTFTLWDEVRVMIEEQTTKYGWLFLYLGANQDAIERGAQLGIRAGQALTYDSARADHLFAAVSGLTTSYRSATERGVPREKAVQQAAFTDKDRELAISGAGGKPPRR